MVVQGGRATDALSVAAVLAISAVVGALAPLVGVVRASDGSALWFAPGALWLGLLPAVVVAALALRRPVVALAFAAGAGVLGAARFLGDLPVVTAPDALARPDLFVETTDRALPLHLATGGFVLLAADLIAVAGGVYAAIRLSGRVSLAHPEPSVSDGARPGRAGSDPAGSDPAGGDPNGPDPSGAAPAGTDSAGPADSAAGTAEVPVPRFAVFDAPTPGRVATRRNYLLTAVGFVAVLLLAWGALSVPYRGGYLAARFVEAGVPLAGLIGAVLLAVLAATAVLVAGTLPRALAVGLLAGVALGACLPYLVAAAAVPTAPVQLSDTVAIGLAGGVLLLVAGLLTRVGWQRVEDDEVEPAASPRPLTAVAGGCGLAAGGLAAAAAFLAPLDAGGLEDVLSLVDGSPVPGSLAFGAAAVAIIVASLFALVPATARAGRAALLVLWATPIPALALAMAVLGDGTIAAARSVGLVAVGPGIWCGVAAFVAACVSAVLAGIAAGRASAAEVAVPDDESIAAARAVTVPVAIGLGALAVASALLPVYGTGGELQGPTILHTAQSWGTWTLLAVTLGAVAVAAVTWHAAVALAVGVAAAAAQGMRLVLAFVVRDATGFALRPGAVLQAVLVLALLGAAVVLAVRAGRVRVIGLDDAELPGARGGGVARTDADGASSDRITPARPTVPARPPGARPGTAARRRSSQNRRKRR